MEKFIAIAKAYRGKHKETSPFIWAMCRDVVRDDVGRILLKFAATK